MKPLVKQNLLFTEADQRTAFDEATWPLWWGGKHKHWVCHAGMLSSYIHFWITQCAEKERGSLATLELARLTRGTRPDSVTANPLKTSREDGNNFISHLDSHQVINPSHLATRNVCMLDKAASLGSKVFVFVIHIFLWVKKKKKTWMETHTNKTLGLTSRASGAAGSITITVINDPVLLRSPGCPENKWEWGTDSCHSRAGLLVSELQVNASSSELSHMLLLQP